MKMNPVLAVIAMINGMIGGLILVLPILALGGGTILSLIVILVTGFFSFYSCYLCLIHLGSHSDLDKAVFYHFWQSKIVRVFYDFMVFINLVFVLLLYFNLIVEQWEGLFTYNIANPICNAVALLILVCVLKMVHFGAQLLGYGIISIICYCLFLIWLVSSAPSCCNVIPLFGKGAVNLAASMGQAFSIQTFFIPVLRQLPIQYQGKYVHYTLTAYIIGGLVYLYIAFAGSFGILNRSIVNPSLDTIERYFSRDQWEVAIVQVIYLVHLYSAFGEFLLVSKKRFFSVLNTIFGVKHSGEDQFFTIPEFIYIVIVIGVSVGVFFANVSIQNLIQINGAVIGFFFIYLIPAVMHFKCLYFTPKTQVIQIKYRITQDFRAKQYQMTERDKQYAGSPNQSINQPLNDYIQRKITQLSRNETNTTPQNAQNGIIVVQDSVATSHGDPNKQLTVQTMNVQCPCRIPQNIVIRILDVFSAFIMILLGLFIMVNGIIAVINHNA